MPWLEKEGLISKEKERNPSEKCPSWLFLAPFFFKNFEDMCRFENWRNKLKILFKWKILSIAKFEIKENPIFKASERMKRLIIYEFYFKRELGEKNPLIFHILFKGICL